ncbi:MAG: hypothetical protein LBD35_01775 [Prevotellaceae bacterium]|jgi:hypothetical protein|nr:hypothetical protein [Prevotellaceae bacterium]
MKSSVLFAALIATMMTTVAAAKLHAQDIDKMNKPRPRTEHKDIDEKKRDALEKYRRKQDEAMGGTTVDSCRTKQTMKQKRKKRWKER